jgi:hypothetical protein
MISPSFVLVCFILFFFLATAIAGAEDEGYLDVVGPSGAVAGANYSEYGSAFEKFMGSAPAERNLSSYPDYLVEFLETGLKRIETNYSLYSPAFEIFMNTSRGGRVNLSSYPDYLGRFLNESNSGDHRTNYSFYSPAFEIFMNTSREGRLPPL